MSIASDRDKKAPWLLQSDAIGVLSKSVNSPRAEFNPNIALTAASQEILLQGCD